VFAVKDSHPENGERPSNDWLCYVSVFSLAPNLISVDGHVAVDSNVANANESTKLQIEPVLSS